MNWKTHIYGAFSAFSLLSLHQGYVDPVVGVFSLVGGLLPDIDANTCVLERFTVFKPLKFAFDAIDETIGKNVFTQHRGVLMHSVWTVLAFLIGTIATSGFTRQIMLGTLIGIISHHALDATTKNGLKLYFYPFDKNRKDVQ